MSGGHFDYWSYPEYMTGIWRDHEINELVDDLFCNGTFSVRGYGGLLQSLDFALSGDTDIEDYERKAASFKRKWMRRTPKTRVEYYQDKLQAYADRLKKELGEL